MYVECYHAKYRAQGPGPRPRPRLLYRAQVLSFGGRFEVAAQTSQVQLSDLGKVKRGPAKSEICFNCFMEVRHEMRNLSRKSWSEPSAKCEIFILLWMPKLRENAQCEIFWSDVEYGFCVANIQVVQIGECQILEENHEN